MTSLDLPIGEDGDSRLGDLIAGDGPDPLDEVAATEVSTTVAGALARLSGDERNVVELRFGLRDGRERTLEATSRELGVSRERARRLEETALRTLGDEPSLAGLRTAA